MSEPEEASSPSNYRHENPVAFIFAVDSQGIPSTVIWGTERAIWEDVVGPEGIPDWGYSTQNEFKDLRPGVYLCEGTWTDECFGTEYGGYPWEYDSFLTVDSLKLIWAPMHKIFPPVDFTAWDEDDDSRDNVSELPEEDPDQASQGAEDSAGVQAEHTS